jgi:hypothetical protein
LHLSMAGCNGAINNYDDGRNYRLINRLTLLSVILTIIRSIDRLSITTWLELITLNNKKLLELKILLIAHTNICVYTHQYH